MKVHTILLNLGGDAGNQVPKFNVSTGEIAVLQAIHGEGAVNEIEETHDVTISNKKERERLVAIYGGAVDGNQKKIVDTLFPGIGARVPEELHELDLDESLLKSRRRSAKADDADEGEDVERAERVETARAGARAGKGKTATEAKRDAQIDAELHPKPRKPRSTRSSATDTGLLGATDGPNPLPPTGKGGAGSLGSKGGVDGQGHDPEIDEDGVKDMPDATKNDFLK